MDSIELTREGAVFVLTMQAGENRFNRGFVDALNGALDEVERSSGPAALVTVGGTEKFYSNGLDLAWMGGDEGRHEGPGFVADVIALFGRLLAYPIPSVAAINGHAFAAGAMLALAHDFRVMRADRGFFCLPEVDINIPLAPGMTALIETKLSAKVVVETVLTGARLGGPQALERGIVDAAVAGSDVLPQAIERAAALAAKDRGTYGALKRGLYARALPILTGADSVLGFRSPSC
jgi:enoyl-CoA hydratase/carnithine racemase